MNETGESTPTRALLEAYSSARYRIREGGRWRVLRVGRPAPLARLAPRGTRFAIVTAWNPRSEARTREANASAHAALVAALDALGLRHVPAVNGDARGRHREPGLLVLGITLARADRLARRFGQNAIVVGKVGAPLRLRVYRGRRAEEFQ